MYKIGTEIIGRKNKPDKKSFTGLFTPMGSPLRLGEHLSNYSAHQHS